MEQTEAKQSEWDFSSWLASNHKNSTKCPIIHEILDKNAGILTMAYYNPF